MALYIGAGDTKKGLLMADTIMNRNNQVLDYYLNDRRSSDSQAVQSNLYEMKIVVDSLKNAKIPEAAKYDAMLQKQLARANS